MQLEGHTNLFIMVAEWGPAQVEIGLLKRDEASLPGITAQMVKFLSQAFTQFEETKEQIP
jgi:hypothetical protein